MIRSLRDRGVSGVPVVDATGVAVGMVTITDLLWLSDALLTGGGPARRGGANTPTWDSTARDVMTPDVFGVEPTATPEELGAFFSRTGLHRALVLEEGRVVGVVSATDLLGLLAEEDAGTGRGP